MLVLCGCVKQNQMIDNPVKFSKETTLKADSVKIDIIIEAGNIYSRPIYSGE